MPGLRGRPLTCLLEGGRAAQTREVENANTRTDERGQMKSTTIVSIAALASLLHVSSEAQAQPYIDDCTSNTNGYCLTVKESSSTAGYAIVAVSTPSANAAAIYAEAQAADQPALIAVNGAASGTGSGISASGAPGGGDAIDATSYGSGIAGNFVAASGDAVQGISTSAAGGFFQSTSNSGVVGQSTSSYGVYGLSSNTTGLAGVIGIATGYSNGIWASAANAGTCALYANNSDAGIGVYGTTASGGIGVEGNTSGSGYAVEGVNTNTSGYAGYFSGQVKITTNLTVSGNLTVAGTCNGTTCSSDIRLKKNVQSLSGSLDDLAKLRPVTFEWKIPDDHGREPGKQFGFIAQEVEKVKPEWVGVDDQGFKTLNTTRLQIMLVDSVRTLKTENDELRDRVKALEAGRRPLISGMGEGGLGIGLVAIAGALIVSRRRRLAE
jgi:hypothetical protein